MSIRTGIAIAMLVLGLLAASSRAGPTVVKTSGRNCSASAASASAACDVGASIQLFQYPFGIGPECSLPGFNLTCAAAGADKPSSLLLGNPSTNVLPPVDMVGVNHFSFPVVQTRIGYFVKLAPAENYSVHWESPGRPFAISGQSNMSLFVAGCGLEVSLTGDSGVEVGNCSVACVGDQIMRRLPDGLCIGIGCCRIDITVTLRAFTLNISRTGQSKRPLEQANAFITYNDEFQFRPSYFESYLDYYDQYYTALSALAWAIPYQPNCTRAMEDRANYACVSNHSQCLESPIGGYVCSCVEGFGGNPYVVNGCVLQQPLGPPPSLQPRGPPPPWDDEGRLDDSMQPRNDCPTVCGNVSLAFPFGTEVGCFAKIQLYLTCNPGTSPPILQMSSDGSVVTGISIDEGTLRVLNLTAPNSSAPLRSSPFAFSREWGVLKWTIGSKTCNDAMASKEGYRCFSHSDCLDVTDDITSSHVGYRCKCSPGFRGNPYLKDGCTRIISGKVQPVILGVAIGISSGCGILFLATVFFVLTRRWKRSVQKRLRKRYFRKNKGILLEQLISSDQQSASDGTKIFSLEELEKATNNFDHTRVVGRGGHGTVYKGILSDQRVVAIKRSSKVEASSEIEQFINEVSILSRINHRNVVKLHGCCLEAEVPLLVYEFISNGTLYDLLHHERDGILLPLPLEERLRIAIEIAGALTYLHSAASMSILHRDVKSMNVLLNDSYIAKVSDFGASRSIPMDQTHLVTVVQGTFGYLDPEYYHTGQLNEKSDVYSFGVILLELLARKKPIFENENGEKQNLSNYFLWAKEERMPLKEVVDEQILGEASEEVIAGVAGLAEECLSLTRGDRPTMKDVEMRLQMLRGRQQSIALPRCDGERISSERGGAVPVPAAGQHGSRQYSLALEQEFLLSSRVPR